MPRRKRPEPNQSPPPEADVLVPDSEDPTEPGLTTHDGKNMPPRYVNGRPNPMHWKAKFAALSDLTHRVTTGTTEEMPRGLNLSQAQEIYAFEAKHYGLDPKHLMDARTDAEKMVDAVDKALAVPEAIFEFADRELDLLEQEFEKIVNLCEEEIKERRYPDGLDELKFQREMERHKKGKAWLNRVRRVKRLREWMRANPVPKGEFNGRAAPFRAAKPLFFMVYVTRSSMKMKLRPAPYDEHKIHLIGPPHARFAVDTWEAENGIDYVKGEIRYGAIPYEGVVLLAHPGLGKTSFVMAHAGYCASTDPYMQAAYLHAKDDKAKEKLAFIKEMFTDSNPMGRRREALFPGLYLADRDNNSMAMRIAHREPTESPTLQACGVGSAGLGGNTNRQYWDDVVPQKDRDQPTERERRFHALNFTWKSRNRGKGCFIMLSGYPFHNDDVVSRHVKMVQEGKVCWLVSRQPCGGPNTTPQFYSVWEEVYPASRLRALFEESGRNVGLWSANYELNPISDSARLIKKLRYYDPLDRAHTNFLHTASFHLSIDPTATNRETSDKAAILYWAVGDVQVREHDGTFFTETRARLIDATRMHLNQVELSRHIIEYANQHTVNEVHLEVHSTNGSATRDLLLEQQIEVKCHPPTVKNKSLRLKSCSGIIDNSSQDPTFAAKIEFPGQWDQDKNGNRTLVCDERFNWLRKQLVDFGVESEDDGVDATSQFVNWLIFTQQIVPGAGEVSRRAAEAVSVGDPRIAAMLKPFENGQPKRTPEEEEDEWIRRLHQ